LSTPSLATQRAADRYIPRHFVDDAKIAGRAAELTDPTSIDDAHHFVIDVLEVIHTSVGTPADHLVIEPRHPDRGLQRPKRR
jgi:hypothetical protein